MMFCFAIWGVFFCFSREDLISVLNLPPFFFFFQTPYAGLEYCADHSIPMARIAPSKATGAPENIRRFSEADEEGVGVVIVLLLVEVVLLLALDTIAPPVADVVVVVGLPLLKLALASALTAS